MIKTQKNEWKWRNLHRWQKFYTAAGSDGMDKFYLRQDRQERWTLIKTVLTFILFELNL